MFEVRVSMTQRSNQTNSLKLMKEWIRHRKPEPVFLNVSGGQESITRKKFRQPMEPGGPVR